MICASMIALTAEITKPSYRPPQRVDFQSVAACILFNGPISNPVAIHRRGRTGRRFRAHAPHEEEARETAVSLPTMNCGLKPMMYVTFRSSPYLFRRRQRAV